MRFASCHSGCYAVGSAVNVQEACQSGRMGLTANELSPYRGPEVQILSPPPRLIRQPTTKDMRP